MIDPEKVQYFYSQNGPLCKCEDFVAPDRLLSKWKYVQSSDYETLLDSYRTALCQIEYLENCSDPRYDTNQAY